MKKVFTGNPLVFWHWDGDCYGQGDWEAQYQECFVDNPKHLLGAGRGSCRTRPTRRRTRIRTPVTTDPPPPDPDDPDPDDENPEEPGPLLESVTTADGGAAGRLFWRELIPDD